MSDAPDDPKPRGGRRGKPFEPGNQYAFKPGDKPAKPFQPGNNFGTRFQKGVSGNPSGRSKTLAAIMRQAREHGPEVIEYLIAIIRDPETPKRDGIRAAEVLLDRGCGKAVVPVYQGEHNLPFEMIGEMGPDGETTALTRAAAKHSEKDQRRKELLAELGRIDREERTDREIRDSQMADAREAERNGEPLPDALRLLLSVRNESE
jgi:hypothetical protein